MAGFSVHLLNEYKNEYGTAYVLGLKKNYTTPKIYMANGDLANHEIDF